MHTFEMGKIRFLVEGGRLQAEGVDHIVDLHGSVFGTLINLLGRCVGSGVCSRVSVLRAIVCDVAGYTY